MKDDRERRVYGDAEVVGLPRRVHLSTLDLAEMILRVYGGRISSSLEEGVTTTLVTSSKTSVGHGSSGLEIVDEVWIARHVDYTMQGASTTTTLWDKRTKGLEVFAYLKKMESSAEKSKLACFDLDSTLIETKSGDIFPVDQDDWQWCSTRIKQMLHQYHQRGYDIVVLTNQANGATNGFEHIKQKIEKVCQDADIPILVLMSVGRNSPFRKPKSGFMEYLSFIYDQISLEDSFYVGDAA